MRIDSKRFVFENVITLASLQMKSGGDKNNTGVAAALIITCSPLVLASHPFVRRRPSRQNHQPSEQQSSGGGKTKDIFRIFIINKNGLWFIMFVTSQGNKR